MELCMIIAQLSIDEHTIIHARAIVMEKWDTGIDSSIVYTPSHTHAREKERKK